MTQALATADTPNLPVEDAARMALSSIGVPVCGAVCDAMAGGLMNHTIRVRTASGDYCVRLRPDSLGASSQLFAAERWALPLAVQAGLDHARLLGRLRLKDGWSAAIFETVDAPRLDHVLAVLDAQEVGGAEAGVDPAQATGPEATAGRTIALGQAWGRDLARLHNLPCDGFGTLLEGSGDDSCAFLSALFMAEHDPLTAIDPALARRFAEKVSEALDQPHLARRRPSYVHGDVHARNLLLRGNRLCWLDWEACRRRLPEFDFAQLPFTNWRGRATLRDAMVEGYTAEAHQALDPLILQLVQIYWHIRFGLFLATCGLPVDANYFGSFDAHMDEARVLLERPPSNWMLRLARTGAPSCN